MRASTSTVKSPSLSPRKKPGSWWRWRREKGCVSAALPLQCWVKRSRPRGRRFVTVCSGRCASPTRKSTGDASSSGTLLQPPSANFYVGFHSKQKGIEFHGDKGSLYLSNWHDFNGSVEYTDFTALPPASDPY